MDHDLAVANGHVRSVEQWRIDCATSQQRSDGRRSEAKLRAARNQRRLLALAVALWLGAAFLAAWLVLH
jgi:hypothetical protein